MANSYYTLYAALRRRENYDEVYAGVLEKLTNQFDLSCVKSCLAIGPGSGENEIPFIQRFMLNLRTLAVVEPDAESVTELKVRLETQLPKAKSTIHETTGQIWDGPEEPVDAVLLFRVLIHFTPTERRALFERLFTQWVVPGGFVVVEIRTEVDSPTDVVRLHDRLYPYRRSPSYEDIKPDMLSAGFSVLFERDFQFQRDFRNPDDEMVRYYQMLAEKPISLDDVRAAIVELFPEGKADKFFMLAVFKRPP